VSGVGRWVFATANHRSGVRRGESAIGCRKNRVRRAQYQHLPARVGKIQRCRRESGALKSFENDSLNAFRVILCRPRDLDSETALPPPLNLLIVN
jgi:hypothetical protein